MILKRYAYIETRPCNYPTKKHPRFRKQNKIKDIGFKITIDTGGTICNFLDVTLDLTNNVFEQRIKKKTQK